MKNQVCPHCKKVNRTSDMSYRENPFCKQCLNERLATAREEMGPIELSIEGHYFKWLPKTKESEE